MKPLRMVSQEVMVCMDWDSYMRPVKAMVMVVKRMILK